MRDDYKYYERSFYNQLSKLKRLIPGVSIIVVGIADMSQKDKDQYVSLPNVTLIRDALKKAAFKADCAFWDTYEAMGGEKLNVKLGFLTILHWPKKILLTSQFKAPNYSTNVLQGANA
jgi:hypothetical protein